MAQIFISHSANSDDFVAGVRDAVAHKLRELGHEPLVDANLINPGDRWRAKLLGWLGACHGAVLLFTSRALHRDWVRAEATILGWRAWLNPAMRVVSVLLDDGVSSASLDELGLKPVQLRDIQVLRSSDVTDTSAGSWAKVIGACFADYRAGPAKDDPMARWLKDVGMHLRGNHYLDEAAARLAIPEPDRVDFMGCLSDIVADRLLHSDAVAIEQAVLELVRDPSLKQALRWFAPLVSCAWLPADMAPVLFEVATGNITPRVTAVHVSNKTTAPRLLKRLTCCDNRYVVIGPFSPDGTGADDKGELLARYVSAILRAVGADSEANWPTSIRSLEKARGGGQIRSLAERLVALRPDMPSRDDHVPSTAEYLDSVRATLELEGRLSPDDWALVERLTLAKDIGERA